MCGTAMKSVSACNIWDQSSWGYMHTKNQNGCRQSFLLKFWKNYKYLFWKDGHVWLKWWLNSLRKNDFLLNSCQCISPMSLISLLGIIKGNRYMAEILLIWHKKTLKKKSWNRAGAWFWKKTSALYSIIS